MSTMKIKRREACTGDQQMRLVLPTDNEDFFVIIWMNVCFKTFSQLLKSCLTKNLKQKQCLIWIYRSTFLYATEYLRLRHWVVQ